MHDAQIALTQVREAATVTEYVSDGDVTFLSSVPLAYFDGCSLSPCWLLDADAMFHVTSHREWFSTFSSGRLGCIHIYMAQCMRSQVQEIYVCHFLVVFCTHFVMYAMFQIWEDRVSFQ